MKALLFAAAITFCTSVFAQESGTPQTIKEVGWALEMPADFEEADSATMAMGVLKGKDAQEEALVKRYGLHKVKNLFGASRNKYNYFNANVNSSGLVNEKNWDVADQAAKQVFFNSFSKQIPFIKIDTSSSVQKIDGVAFKKFQATCYISMNNIFNVVYMGAFYKEKYFTISYYSLEHSAGNELDQMVADSKFDK